MLTEHESVERVGLYIKCVLGRFRRTVAVAVGVHIGIIIFLRAGLYRRDLACPCGVFVNARADNYGHIDVDIIYHLLVYSALYEVAAAAGNAYHNVRFGVLDILEVEGGFYSTVNF